MVTESLVIFEYEDILMGKRKNFEVAFTNSVEVNRKIAGIIWRYAIEELLGWTPEQALIYLDQKIVKALKLDLTYCRIKYEYSTKKFFDFRFILQYAFPERITYNLEENARSEYERVTKMGEWENTEEPYKFHKNYFSGPEGIQRASVVLYYAISIDLADLSICELYKFFGNKRKATLWLSKRKLEVNVKSLYKSPLEYLHHSLPQGESNIIYFINEWLKMTCLNKK